MQVRGVRPFFSEKYDITRHPRYQYLSDADKKNTGAAAAQRATISEKSYGSSKRKWREWHMRNNRLLPYETIVQATSGEPEAVGTVLQYYRRRIQCAARVNGRVDQDTEDYITQTLLTAIFKFRFGR